MVKMLRFPNIKILLSKYIIKTVIDGLEISKYC